MASQIKHYINGTEIYPKNGDDIGIKMNFSQDEQGETVNELSVDNVILATEAKKLVLNHLSTLGAFQGVPYSLDIDGVGIDMFVNLIESPKISGEGDSSIEAKVEKRKSWKQFKENADNLSFEAINKTHQISVFDIPYVIIPDNQGASFISAAIGTFVLGKALKESVMELAKAAEEAIEAAAPTDVVAGVSVGIGGGAVTGVVVAKPASVVMAVLKLVARVIYFIAILVLLVDMVNRMLQIISPLVHNLKGSKVLELVNKGCAKLGYTFQSSILSNTFKNALTIVPVPLIDNNNSIWQQLFFNSFSNSYNTGYPTASDSIKTLGALIDALLAMFNAKILVTNGLVQMERRDFWLNISADSITNTLNLQGERENQWTFNTTEAWKRYYIHYQTDFSDLHTLDNVDGVYAEFSTEPITVQNVDLVNIKGLKEISIPFSFGSRKEKQTALETAFKALSVLVNAAGSVLGGSGSTNPLQSSAGVLQISQQHFTTTKLMYITGGGKQPSNFRSQLNALGLWNNFHKINEVSLNFKEIYTASVAFSSGNFVALQGNNYIYDQDNNLLEILDLEWNNGQKTANITYAVKSQTSTNTKTIQIRP